MKSKYYGEKEVVNIIERDDEVELVFADKTTEAGYPVTSEVIAKKMLPYVLTDKKSDLTNLRDRRVEPVIKDILSVLLSWRIRPFDPMNELTNIADVIIASFNDSVERTWTKTWGKPKSQTNLHDINTVLTEDDAPTEKV